MCPALTLQQLYRLTEYHHDDWLASGQNSNTVLLLERIKQIVDGVSPVRLRILLILWTAPTTASPYKNCCQNSNVTLMLFLVDLYCIARLVVRDGFPGLRILLLRSVVLLAYVALSKL